MTKILIADDSAFALNMLKNCVEKGGHEVVGLANGGKQALTLFKDLRPKLLILDYLMPDKNGMEVLKEIKQFDTSARVIMISGTYDHTIQKKALKAGALAYVDKYDSAATLLKTIDHVLENPD